ncbi:hypothetical protein KHP60_15210 [Microvirga sp. 3-52]|uniref:hypothetical protein n=1 Tax=Microvirga sp. 3-52 TaxID=2792425 RepID=UPI001AC9345E|nr:hypothetical protein [Microvirga sp. 3-52]MBO1906463.1 hypothetical protein [Microvirga sp. 3-52]MBS7453680.1 hypothetical protein [Microvirga sp. 3-52]
MSIVPRGKPGPLSRTRRPTFARNRGGRSDGLGGGLGVRIGGDSGISAGVGANVGGSSGVTAGVGAGVGGSNGVDLGGGTGSTGGLFNPGPTGTGSVRNPSSTGSVSPNRPGRPGQTERLRAELRTMSEDERMKLRHGLSVTRRIRFRHAGALPPDEPDVRTLKIVSRGARARPPWLALLF